MNLFFGLVTFLSANVSPEERLNPGYGNLKECPFPTNRGVKLTFDRGTRYKDSYVKFFFWDQILCPLKGGVL